MQSVDVKGEVRTDFGKSASKKLRKEGRVPFVIYGGEENIHGTMHPLEIRPLVHTPDFKLGNVEVDSNTYKCIIKEVQYHPVTDAILHVDFLQLIDGNTIKVEVPVRFEGVAPGIRSGGTLITKLRRIKIKTTPDKMVDEITLDISELELGSSVRVHDIEEIDGVEIMNASGIPVASVEIPRVLKSAEAEEEEAAAAAAAEGVEEGEGAPEGEAAAEGGE